MVKRIKISKAHHWAKFKTIKRTTGKRSGLEVAIAAQLDAAGVAYTYEPGWIHFTRPERPAKYLPDFAITETKIIIEGKGWFPTADRQKHLLIKAQRPTLDIRFVFCDPQARISKQSHTTYAMWCQKHGFQYAKLTIPKEWLTT